MALCSACCCLCWHVQWKTWALTYKRYESCSEWQKQWAQILTTSKRQLDVCFWLLTQYTQRCCYLNQLTLAGNLIKVKVCYNCIHSSAFAPRPHLPLCLSHDRMLLTGTLFFRDYNHLEFLKSLNTHMHLWQYKNVSTDYTQCRLAYTHATK